VREAAYFLWQCEGRPEGRAEMHWAMAEIGIVLLGYLSHGRGELPPQRHSYDDSEAA
jgi:Protein of unknown function (DUF2934)